MNDTGSNSASVRAANRYPLVVNRFLLRCVLAGSILTGSAAACGGGDSQSGAGDPAPEPTTVDAAAATTTEATTTTTAVVETSAIEAEAGEFLEDPVAGDLVGRWAHFDVVAYQDAAFKTLIVSYGFNDFAEDNGEIVDSASFCFSEQRTNQPIKTNLSDAATQAIKPPSTPLQVEVTDGALSIRRDATPTPVGVRLDDPANESLPTDPDDPRIVDDDGDGQPGITVEIDAGAGITGELYIARREIFSYDAVLTAPDVIEGAVIDNSEQLVIGASESMFMTSANFEQVTDAALNPIILKRVDPDWDCARLADERDNLFPPTPDVDW